MNFDYPLGWFFKSVNQRSPSFTGVQYLYDFLTRTKVNRGPFAVAVDVAQALPGDIVQLSFDGVKWSHSLLVVHQNGDDPYLATHSYDAFGRLLSSYSFAAVRALQILGGRT